MQDNWKDAVLSLKEQADRLGVQFVQAHSQGGNPLLDDENHVDFLLKTTLRSIEICEMLGIRNTVVHSGQAAGASKEERFVKNKTFYEILFRPRSVAASTRFALKTKILILPYIFKIESGIIIAEMQSKLILRRA